MQDSQLDPTEHRSETSRRNGGLSRGTVTPEGKARAGQFLYESTERRTVNWRDHLAAFISETDRFLDLLDGVMPEIRWLSDDETLTSLHACISTQRHPVAVPDVPFHLDALLSDCDFTGVDHRRRTDDQRGDNH